MYSAMLQRASFRVAGRFCHVVLGTGLLCLTTSAAESSSAALPAPPSQQVDFTRDVQPILAKHCYACHGPDKQKGDLRWDVKASAFKTGDHGPIIVPGKSEASRMIVLVSGLDPESVMPPRGERLT